MALDDFDLLSRRLREMMDGPSRQLRMLTDLGASRFDAIRRLSLDQSDFSTRLREVNLVGPLADSVARQLVEMQRVDRALAESVVLQIADLRCLASPIEELSASLAASARRVWSLGADLSPELPIAVLAPLPTVPGIGTLAWHTATGGRRDLSLGVWSIEEQEPEKLALPSQTIQIACEVSCLMCGDPLFSDGGEIRLTSRAEPIVRVSVAPWCPRCEHAMEENPEYESQCMEQLLQFLDDRSRPRYHLLQGGGEGTKPPRGRQLFTLVKVIPTGDEDERDNN